VPPAQTVFIDWLKKRLKPPPTRSVDPVAQTQQHG
jgi:hypothetical protein